MLRAGFRGISSGWNASGSPVELLGKRTLLRRDGGTLLHNGKGASIDDAQWSFAGAETDQGLFVYMLLYRHATAARFAHNSYTNPAYAHRVAHYAGGGPTAKPWNRAVARVTAIVLEPLAEPAH